MTTRKWRVYGWTAHKLAEAYTLDELNELRRSIEADPKSKSDGRGLHIYNTASRRKLDAVLNAVLLRAQADRDARQAAV